MLKLILYMFAQKSLWWFQSVDVQNKKFLTAFNLKLQTIQPPWGQYIKKCYTHPFLHLKNLLNAILERKKSLIMLHILILF